MSAPAAFADASLVDIVDRIDGARRLVEALRMALESLEPEGTGDPLDELAGTVIGLLLIASGELTQYKNRTRKSSL